MSLAIVLAMVGIKMLAHSLAQGLLGPSFNLYLLAVVVVILGIGVIASLIELRWRDQISSRYRAVVRKLKASGLSRST